jgi:hypothetical protein
MWGALLAVSIAGWLHQLTATPGPDSTLIGHSVREGQAMIAHPAAQTDPGTRTTDSPRRRARTATTTGLSPARHRPRPPPRLAGNVLTRPHSPTTRNPLTRGDTQAFTLTQTQKTPTRGSTTEQKINPPCYSRIRV